MKYLIIVDAQNDFITGSLGTEEAKSAVPHILERIRRAKADDYEIMFTMDLHDDGYANTQEGRKLPVEHCRIETDGSFIQPDIFAEIGNYPATFFHKHTFGCMELMRTLKNTVKDDDTIEIVGFCTDICVIANALLLKTALPETEICVNEECCAGSTPEMHEAALAVMTSCQIDIVKFKI